MNHLSQSPNPSTLNASTVLDTSMPITFRTLPAVAGFYWIYRGWILFMNKPWTIVSAVATICFVNLMFAFIPLVGPILSGILNPTLHLGLMGIIAIRAMPTQDSTLKQLFTVFYRPKALNRMLRLGCAYIVSVIISMLLAISFVSDEFIDVQQKIMNNEVQINDATVQAVVFDGLTLILPMMMLVILLFWFTNQLIGWHGQSIRKALFFNIMAIWRNKIAFLIYLISCIVIGVALLLLTALIPNHTYIQLLVLPSILVVVSWFLCSVYASYESMIQTIS